MTNTRKELEKLYCWSEFYRQNQRFSDLEKVKKQIEEFKTKHDLK
jgi:hypothetical protein